MSHKITFEMLHPSIVEDINKNTTGDPSGLETPVNTSIVDAINSLNAEHTQSKENREKLAEAIGEPIGKTDSIDEMVVKIQEMKENLAETIGEPIGKTDSIDEMAVKIQEMKENLKTNLVNKGIEIAEDTNINEMVNMIEDINVVSSGEIIIVKKGTNDIGTFEHTHLNTATSTYNFTYSLASAGVYGGMDENDHMIYNPSTLTIAIEQYRDNTLINTAKKSGSYKGQSYSPVHIVCTINDVQYNDVLKFFISGRNGYHQLSNYYIDYSIM